MEIFTLMIYFVVGLILISFISIISCAFCKGTKEKPSVNTESLESGRQKSAHMDNTDKTCVTVDVFHLGGDKSSILLSGGESFHRRSFNVSIHSSKQSLHNKSPENEKSSGKEKSAKLSLKKKLVAVKSSKSDKKPKSKEVTKLPQGSIKGSSIVKQLISSSAKKSPKASSKSDKGPTKPIRMKRGDPGLTAPIKLMR